MQIAVSGYVLIGESVYILPYYSGGVRRIAYK